MSKKVNFGTINAQSLSMLSDFSVAYEAINAINDNYKTRIKEVQDKIDKVLENRHNDAEAGLSTDEVTRKWSTTELNVELRKLQQDKVKELEPHKKAYKDAMAMLSDDLYAAYETAMNNGSYTALSNAIHKFLIEIGCITTESTTSKFANIMAIRCSGARKASGKAKKEGHYISNKRENQFKEIFMLTFLEYVIIDKKVVTKHEDNTLSMTVYED